MAVHIQNRMIQQVADQVGITFEEAAADLMAAVPSVLLVSGDYQVMNRRQDARCDDWAAHKVAGIPTTTHTAPIAEAITPRQLDYLISLLHRVIARQDGSAYGSLVREDEINLDAVSALTKAQASATIAQITGR